MTKCHGKPLQRVAPPDFRSRLARAVWQLVWFALARFTPIAFHRWRCWLLRRFGAKIEGICWVYPTTKIWAPWNLSMEARSCLAAGVDCYNVAEVRLGAGVTVSQRSFLCTASHDFDNADFALIGASISIEPGAWVAAEAFIGPGVHLGERAVVLARAVVVRDVPPRMVVGGNPARDIRNRFISKRQKGNQS